MKLPTLPNDKTKLDNTKIESVLLFRDTKGNLLFSCMISGTPCILAHSAALENWFRASGVLVHSVPFSAPADYEPEAVEMVENTPAEHNKVEDYEGPSL